MVALYVRVSTKEQLDGYSIDEQIEKLKAYCKAKGFKDYKVYTDGGFSGGSLDRPALKELLTDVKLNKIKTVIVYKLDRLSRSQKDTLYIIEDVLLKNNCAFMSLTENFDTATPFGKAMIGILSVFAQLEREQIKERMSLGLEGRAKKGLYKGGCYIPFGYDYKDGELIINDFEARQVRECFDLYIDGHSMNDISRLFYEKGYKRKHGYWTPPAVRKCLTNNVYIGKVKYKGNVYDGLHKPIIDKDTFEIANNKYEKNFKKPRPMSKSLLGGLIWCKCCGCRYTTISTRGYRYYACGNFINRNRYSKQIKKCDSKKYWSEKKLDDLVLGEIQKINLGDIKKKTTKEDNAIKNEIKNIDNKINRVVELFIIDGIDKVKLQQKLDDLNKQKSKLEKEINRAPAEIKDIESWDDVIKNATAEQMRAIVGSLIDRIDIDGEDVYIKWVSE